jgi:hypothetical protein
VKYYEAAHSPKLITKNKGVMGVRLLGRGQDALEEAFLGVQCLHSGAKTVGVKFVGENVSADLLHQIARLSSAINLSFTARR